ncbi:E3 ubiquitin-protein ligase TRIM71-like isoform X1 [Ruditapes philippinarum]|uniref:E3 ubiquitin-protein ligase TRIM71-like isoform X1 n=1 Tax=Ruditapes philippinarum TaxID=129788 RepID=UPI00295A591A|nr:E3 ubiquitin-protein ligase TRIM71-like isoform X1 [Ruditapes philippinarum]
MAVPGKKASQKFSSTLSQGGAEDFDIYCEICDMADIRLPAFGYCVDCEEHLCQSCFNTHRRPRPLRHHQLLDEDHMPQQRKLHGLSKSTSSPQTCDLTKPCTKHTKEVIKFYCHDHNALICSVCVTLEHTPTSCNVDYIPDISAQNLYSTEFKETLKDIDELINKCSLIKSGMKQRVATSTTSLKNAIAENENFKKEIHKGFDKLEKEVKDTATTVQLDNNKKLKTTETTCDDINKSLQASADTLKYLNSNKQTDQLLTELKRAQQLIQDNNNILSQLPTINDIDEYIFEPNQAIKKVLQDEKSLGTLSSKKLKQPAEPNNQGAVAMKMSTHLKINAKSSSYENDCWITGIAVSPQNQIFAADYYNDSIKMIHINSGTKKKLKLDSAPWDITFVSSDSLAVTIPDSKTIQLTSFSPYSLSLKNKLKVDGRCYGISHHRRKLAVTFTKPAKLQIMDLKGNTEITVEKDSNGDNIFSYPQYVTTNSHSIYVSDSDNDVVLRFNWKGEMIGLVGIKGPRGITLLDNGSLLVNGRDSQSIHRVSGNCQDSRTILEDVGRPFAACWCAKSCALCVSTLNEDGDDNYIKLYEKM